MSEHDSVYSSYRPTSAELRADAGNVPSGRFREEVRKGSNEDAYAEADLLGAYPEGIFTFGVSSEANWADTSANGTVVTSRTGIYGHQVFSDEYGGLRFRATGSTDGSFTPWAQYSSTEHVHDHIGPLESDAYNEAHILDYYQFGLSVMPVSAGANWGPNTGEAGHVTTERNGSTGRQTFVVPATETSYIRYYSGGAWGAWAEIATV